MNASPIDVQAAFEILRNNDRGGYTVPTHGLYPFQWSWDSAITALGWRHADEARAWEEAEVMFRGQWDNGMLPHILFHKDAETYFPGPDVWGATDGIPSSAISQPAVWATCLRMLYDEAKDRDLAERKMTELLPGLIRYHDWWYRERDRDGTGLVVSFHPWESGMDNSPAWDDALARVPTIDWEYQRRDLGHVDADERPHKTEYDRYLYLVDFYKQNGFDSDAIYRDCPYRVLDIGLIAILHRGTRDLVALCDAFDRKADSDRLRDDMARTEAAIGKLWSDDRRCFLNYDVIADEPIEEVTTATVLPLYAGLANDDQAQEMVDLIREWEGATSFAISSTHPSSSRYEPQRYWRGPVWLHINWLIALGLKDYGYEELADRLRVAARKCVETSGFFEYFDAESGAGCGGDDFSWTAAVAINWLA